MIPAHTKVPDMPERESSELLLSVRMHGVLVPVEVLSPGDAEKSGEALREHNQAAGKARVHGQVNHALTIFKRFATSLRKVEPGLLAHPGAHHKRRWTCWRNRSGGWRI